ncbi:hypothetical protein K493DRAFT_301580 [Basidiobolus meristosporus CBS 931.73]|uniref:Arrestin-like N-terminal domain-containing protein n=1 Tax=Basidiobolus meristosporus CBS 931.73 TaxID=1314790 RepID=A0A1Y1YB98_9FUNG|nr:hypothetical protein K493DRAFT_301580 [Basidiobolus meristosporus CBS 931.73]|eukprot:ORX95279.1 hypothetical protein K493DRAFT_301580 [Basidiobolus meristosporus CBS 931.73]
MKTADCDILLEKSALVLHGCASEAAGAALRGVLVLRLKKETKVKSIRLQLEGRVQIAWESDRIYTVDETVIDNVLTIIRPNTGCVLPKGNTVYEFEFRFPGDLPETVFTPCGQIKYHINAVIERPHIFRDIYIQKPILVRRQPYLINSDTIDDSLNISQIYKNAANVQIQAPTRSYMFGETIPLHITLSYLMGNVSICRIALRLVQTMVLGIPGTSGTKKLQQWREISNNAVSCNEFIFNTRLPEDIFQPACSTKYIETTHEAILIISFTINGKVECGYVTFGINLTCKREEDESLPTYTPVKAEDASPKLPSYTEVTICTNQGLSLR